MPANPVLSVIDATQGSELAMTQAELAGAASIGLVMLNAAQAQQACQQIELSVIGVICTKILTATPAPTPA